MVQASRPRRWCRRPCHAPGAEEVLPTGRQRGRQTRPFEGAPRGGVLRAPKIAFVGALRYRTSTEPRPEPPTSFPVHASLDAVEVTTEGSVLEGDGGCLSVNGPGPLGERGDLPARIGDASGARVLSRREASEPPGCGAGRPCAPVQLHSRRSPPGASSESVAPTVMLAVDVVQAALDTLLAGAVESGTSQETDVPPGNPRTSFGWRSEGRTAVWSVPRRRALQ